MSRRSTPPMRTAAASGSAKRAMRVASVDLLEALTLNETGLERGGLDHTRSLSGQWQPALL